MWELLQKLEDLGWKPYGKSIAELTETEKNVRLLTSLSSGLWQFVCENGMVKKPDKYWKRYRELTISDGIVYMSGEYEYRIIESALKDESKLEDFLLSNIKVGGKTD